MKYIFDPLRCRWAELSPGNPGMFNPVPTHSELTEAVRNQEAKEAAEKKEAMSQWIIWNPKSTQPPRVIHNLRPEAIRVAGRMAHENPGQEFYVCKLVTIAAQPAPVVQAVTYKDLER